MIAHEDLIQVAFSCKWSVLTILAEKSVPVEAPLETALIHHVGEFSLLHKFNTLELSIKDPLLGFLNIKVIHRFRLWHLNNGQQSKTYVRVEMSEYFLKLRAMKHC